MDHSFDSVLEKVIDLVENKLPAPVILIDGPAGSGKTTFAKNLQDALFRTFQQSPKVIHMDDLYPGWEGLAEGSSYLVQKILKPLSNSNPASWQQFDWERGIRAGDDPGNGWREFDGGTVLIIEGCGSISKESAQLSDLRIWLEANEDLRRKRWLEREGDSEYFSIWSAQEDEFYEFHNSKSLSDYKFQTDN